jgi:hypothetical protein
MDYTYKIDIMAPADPNFGTPPGTEVVKGFITTDTLGPLVSGNDIVRYSLHSVKGDPFAFSMSGTTSSVLCYAQDCGLTASKHALTTFQHAVRAD